MTITIREQVLAALRNNPGLNNAKLAGLIGMDTKKISGTVSALLDELERKEEQRANWFQVAEKLGADLDAAERRIAEMEARDKPKFVQCWSCKHDIEVLAIADCDGYCPRCAAPIDLDDEPYAAAGKGE